MDEKSNNFSTDGGLKIIQLNDQKAGMQGLDKEAINKVIFEASKGTPYFAFQEKRQKSIDSRVKELILSLEKVTQAERNSAFKRMNIFGESLKVERDLSHSIVHIDMDAFYAAVEMEDDPKFQDKPMAVGSLSMLATSNYEARKYGVRAGMPGFIAKKLCPNLIIVPCNFHKYKAVSKKVCQVIEKYDPNYCPASLDEMYFDLTEYIKRRYKMQLHSTICEKKYLAYSNSSDVSPVDIDSCTKCSQLIDVEAKDKIAYEIVSEIRQKIFETTNLTASAGIAPNVMLAKVCSDQNKPNGQYQIPSTLEAVESFVSTLPVKKVSGIGPVQAQILNAVGINTCSDLWDNRDIVDLLFSATSSDFYIRVSLGIGRTTVKSEYVRKSIGVEQTFREMHTKEELMNKCEELCEEAVSDLQLHNMVGKVVVLKYKTTNFESHTRNHTLPYHTVDRELIIKAARKLLDGEICSLAPQPLKLRLMGIRIEKLIAEDSLPNADRQQIRIKHFFKSKLLDPLLQHSTKCHFTSNSVFDGECSSNTLIDSVNAHEKNEDVISVINDSENLNIEQFEESSFSNLQNSDSLLGNKTFLNSLSDFGSNESATDSEMLERKQESNPTKIPSFICPICQKEDVSKTLSDFNHHIDDCLNKVAIRKILSEDSLNSKRKLMKTDFKLENGNESNRKIKRIDEYFH